MVQPHVKASDSTDKHLVCCCCVFFLVHRNVCLFSRQHCQAPAPARVQRPVAADVVDSGRDKPERPSLGDVIRDSLLRPGLTDFIGAVVYKSDICRVLETSDTKRLIGQ